MKVTGGCHCGHIKYEAEVEPGTVRVCHCTDCQKLTGTAFRTNIASLPDTFRFLSGTPKIYIKTAESGNKRAHAFCPECGTPIYAAAPEPNPSTYGLRVGGIDQRAALGPPTRQIWCRSALPWSMDISGGRTGRARLNQIGGSLIEIRPSRTPGFIRLQGSCLCDAARKAVENSQAHIFASSHSSNLGVL